MRRMLGGRELEQEEVVRPENGLRGDCRRDNLALSSKSEAASTERPGTWSGSGVKYVYQNEYGRFFVNFKGVYLGTYGDPETAATVIDLYQEAIERGMEKKEAVRFSKKPAAQSPEDLF